MARLLGLVVLIFSCISEAKNKDIPLEIFAKESEFTSVQVSPEGDYLSVKTTRDGKAALMILERAKMKLINVVQLDGDAQVGGYSWVSKDRLVFTKQYLRGYFAEPTDRGELLAVNADGSKSKYLMGYNSAAKSTGASSNKAQKLRGSSFVLDPLVDDAEHFLAFVYPWGTSTSGEPFTSVYKVNAYTGKRKEVTQAPVRLARFLTDAEGQVRIAVSGTEVKQQKIFHRQSDKSDWKRLDTEKLEYKNVVPWLFTNDGKSIIAAGSKDGEAESVISIPLDGSAISVISTDGTVSPKNIWIDATNREIFAVEYENGYPTYLFVNKSAPLSKRLKGMLGALAGHQVQLVSSSKDNNYQVVYASNDRNPGDFYFYDAGANKLSYLFSTRNWVDPDKMSETQPVEFTSRDGKQIHGYVTLPAGKEAKNLPLVVMPHGGPHGPRDYWGYDSTAQMLASRGMAVLKVNFRGSGGYGKAFEESGHRKWHTEIQYDIIDGAKHLVKEGTVNANNMCIMGASFGGYSALQSPIVAPDMFKCAIGVVGVYDMPMMFTEGDIPKRKTGVKFLEMVLGIDEKELKVMSPSYNVDKLKAAIFLVHGEQDPRAPVEHADSLIAALEKIDYPYEYLLFDEEGHGFYKYENRVDYYERVLKFLNKHLEL